MTSSSWNEILRRRKNAPQLPQPSRKVGARNGSTKSMLRPNRPTAPTFSLARASPARVPPLRARKLPSAFLPSVTERVGAVGAVRARAITTGGNARPSLPLSWRSSWGSWGGLWNSALPAGEAPCCGDRRGGAGITFWQFTKRSRRAVRARCALAPPRDHLRQVAVSEDPQRATPARRQAGGSFLAPSPLRCRRSPKKRQQTLSKSDLTRLTP